MALTERFIAHLLAFHLAILLEIFIEYLFIMQTWVLLRQPLFVRLAKSMSTTHFFMYCQRQPTTSIPYIVGSDQFQGNISAYRFQGQHALELTNLRWAVGGFGLYLDSPISSASQYNNLLTAENAWSGFKAIAPRAAIFYIGGSAVSENIVLFTVFADMQLYSGTSSTLSSRSGGVTPYELRSIIKDIFPTATSHGIILDGGSSTGIAYKNASGGLYAQMVGTYANTMIVTSM